MKLQTHFLLIVIVTAAFLVSCQRQAVVDEQLATDSAQVKSPEPEPLQACDLITRESLEGIVGAALLEPRQSTIYSDGQVLSQACLFLAADNLYSPTIQIDLQTAIAEPLLDSWLATQSSAAASPRYRVLTLPPAQASYQSDRGLEMLVNDYGVSVEVLMPKPEDNQSAAQAIAEQILSGWTATPSATSP